MKRAERIVLVGIVVAVAVALRWGFVATAFVPNPLRADAGEYARYAQNLVTHGVYSLSTQTPPPPDSFRSPGYPVFLAACRAVAGEAHWLTLVLALQVVLGAATVVCTFLLASRLLPYAVALTAAVLVALSPHLVVSGAYVLTECLTTFALTLGLCLLASAPERSVTRHAIAGLALGAAVLCNEVLVFVPLALLWPLRRRSGGRVAAVCVGLALLPMALWTARNQSQQLVRRGSERVVASISHGSYPGMVHQDPRYFGFPYREDPAQPVFGSSWSDLVRVLGPRVTGDPMRYLTWYALQKPVWLWSWDLVQGNGVLVYDVSNNPYDSQAVVAASGWLMRTLHFPLMLLAALTAAWAAWNRGGRAGFVAQCLGLVALLGTLAYVPVIPDPRYLQPFRPAVFVLAAVALHRIAEFVRARSPRTAATVPTSA